MPSFLRLLTRIIPVVAVATTGCGGPSSMTPRQTRQPVVVDPNWPLYFTPMMTNHATDPEWASPKWNVGTGIKQALVQVLEDTDHKLVLQAAPKEGLEAVMFAIQVDARGVEDAVNHEIMTARGVSTVDEIRTTGTPTMFGEPTMGYASHKNGVKIETHMARRGRCLFSLMVVKNDSVNRNEATVGAFTGEMLKNRIHALDVATRFTQQIPPVDPTAAGAGGAVCAPSAGPVASGDPRKDADAAARTAAIAGLYRSGQGPDARFLRIEATGLVCVALPTEKDCSNPSLPKGYLWIGTDNVAKFMFSNIVEHSVIHSGTQLQMRRFVRGTDRQPTDHLFDLVP